jgi:hypothetical protein
VGIHRIACTPGRALVQASEARLRGVHLKEFLYWLKQVIRKWWVWLGLLPLILDLAYAYIPSAFIPPPIDTLLEVGANWQLTLILMTVGLLISAFRVHLETASRLAAYEYQAAEYELKTYEVTSNLCISGCHVEVHCQISIRGTNPFKGELKHISLSTESQMMGLGPWKIHRTYWGRAQSSLPITVPDSECDLAIVIHAAIEKEASELGPRDNWRNVEFLLHLVTEYFTQRIGYVQKLLPVRISADLGEQYDTLASSLGNLS